MSDTLGSATLSTAGRNAAADAIDALINTGGAGSAVLKSGATTLATFTLNNPAFGNAATGAIALNTSGLSVSATGGTNSIPDMLIINDHTGTAVLTIAVTGSSGITTGDTVTLSSYTFTIPAS